MGRPVVNPYPFHGWNFRTQVTVAVIYGIATGLVLWAAIARLLAGPEKPTQFFDVVMFFTIAAVIPVIGAWVIIRGRRPRPDAKQASDPHSDIT